MTRHEQRISRGFATVARLEAAERTMSATTVYLARLAHLHAVYVVYHPRAALLSSRCARQNRDRPISTDILGNDAVREDQFSAS
jgi:uncharacterized membrane protein